VSSSDVLAVDVPWQRRHDVVGWAVCFFAAAVMYAYLPQVVHSVRMWAWPTVPGQILSQDATSELVYVEIHRYSNSNVTEHRLHVRYAYAVNGQYYIGTSISGVRPWVHDSRSERRRLAAGNPVTVHYDAASPSDAVLDVAPPADAVLWSSLSIAALTWIVRRSLRRKRRSA
jgi:hypothetical protein